MKNFICKAVFLFLVLFSAPSWAMTSGTTTTGSISPGGTSSQSFTGNAGQGIVLHGYASYGVVMEIKKPDGTALGTYTNRTAITLPATGTYPVTIKGSFPTDSGTYSLYYVRGSDSVANGPLTSGTSYNGNMTTNGVESFQFTGTAGQGVIMSTGAAYGIQISLFNPDGSPWSSTGNRFSGTLGTTGTYTVVLEGSFYASAGPYRSITCAARQGSRMAP